MPDLVETVDIMHTVIKMQSCVINRLFKLLMQHISAEEADSLPEIAMVNEIARLRAGLEG